MVVVAEFYKISISLRDLMGRTRLFPISVGFLRVIILAFIDSLSLRVSVSECESTLACWSAGVEEITVMVCWIV